MDTRVLNYFLEVVNQGNITKAAEKLHITQPTLSRQLMELEKEIGAKLFERGKRKIQLTEAGYLYHKRVREMMGILDKAQKEVSYNSDEIAGVLSIGCVETKATEILMDHVKVFHEQYPNVQFEFYNGFSDDIKSRLDAEQLDFGILLEPVEAAKYEYRKLPVMESWGVLVAADHHLAGREQVQVGEIVNEPLILTSRNIVLAEVEAWLGVDKDSLDVVGTHNLLTNSLPLIRNGVAITVVVEGAFDIRSSDDFVFIPFIPEKKSGHVIAWKKSMNQTKLCKLFLEQMLEKIDKI